MESATCQLPDASQVPCEAVDPSVVKREAAGADDVFGPIAGLKWAVPGGGARWR